MLVLLVIVLYGTVLFFSRNIYINETNYTDIVVWINKIRIERSLKLMVVFAYIHVYKTIKYKQNYKHNRTDYDD